MFDPKMIIAVKPSASPLFFAFSFFAAEFVVFGVAVFGSIVDAN
jgi:hypothetical protein